MTMMSTPMPGFISRWFLIGALLLTLSEVPALAALPEAGELHIEKVVLLMRHGVRSGTLTEEIAGLSKRKWPDFGIAAGQLTAHGRAALILWGQFHRRQLAQQGVLPANGAVKPGDVITFASPMQRTRESAEAFLEGLSPESEQRLSSADTLPWFIPPLSGLRHASSKQVQQAVTEALKMPIEDAQTFYRPALQAIEKAFHIRDERLSLRTWQLYGGEASLHITPLREVEDMVETIRMQYANNLPLQDVAFGLGTDQAAISRLMTLHSLAFAVTRSPRYLAVRNGKNLISEISTELLHGNPDPGDSTESPVSLFVGHDGNLAVIRAILGFDWQVPEHPRNDVNPGAMLKFERVRNARDGQRYIRISYLSPTLDQLRNLSPFTVDSLPFGAAFMPGLPLAPSGSDLIPLQRFASLAADVTYEVEAERLADAPAPG